MSTPRCGSVLVVGLLVILVASSFAFAQAQERLDVAAATSFVGLGFGARAIGMGGAFVAVADDATAIFWNPAGLAQLEKPEVSLVLATATSLDMYGYRDWVLLGDTYWGIPVISDTSIDREGFGVDFLSAVFPKREGDQKSAWGISYSRDGSFEWTAALADPGVPGLTPAGTDSYLWSTEFNSLTLAYAAGTDESMWGASVIRQTADYEQLYSWKEPGASPFTLAYADEDTALGWQIGWLGKKDKTSYGLTYRSSGGQDVERVDEFPASWSVGVATRQSDKFRWAVAYRRLEEVDRNTVVYYPINGYHIGGEWILQTREGKPIPLRLGFYRRDPDEEGIDATDVFTIGSGVAGPNWSADVALEFGTEDFNRITLSLVSATK